MSADYGVAADRNDRLTATGRLLAQVEDAHRKVEGAAMTLLAEVRALREARDRAEAIAAERGEALDRYSARLGHAREQAAESMREAAQLHKALDSLGTSPEKLAQQVGAGMAVTLYGRTYVDRRSAARWAMDAHPPLPDVDKTEGTAAQQPTLQVANEAASPMLLEADRGVFLPIPAGYMLSVSVTPWDDSPVPDED